MDCFTAASDLALLGNLLRSRLLCNFVISDLGLAFLRAICVPAPQQQQSSRQLLNNAWFCCGGLSSSDVGAQFGE
jgi:hypothetical protein